MYQPLTKTKIKCTFHLFKKKQIYANIILKNNISKGSDVSIMSFDFYDWSEIGLRR